MPIRCADHSCSVRPLSAPSHQRRGVYKGTSTKPDGVKSEDHCVHIVQVRSWPDGEAPPVEAFEVWVYDRSLCHFCAMLPEMEEGLLTSHSFRGGASPPCNRTELGERRPRASTYDPEQLQTRASQPSSASASAKNYTSTETELPQGSKHRPQSAHVGGAPALWRRRNRSVPNMETTKTSQDEAISFQASRSIVARRTETVVDLARIAKRVHMDLKKVIELKDDFDRFDVNQKGYLNKETFKDMVVQTASYDQDRSLEVPSQLFQEHWFETRVNGVGECIDFERYLDWYQANYFEGVFATPASQRMLRSLANKHDLNIISVERIYQIFQEFDEDQSMSLEYPEFCKMLLCLLGAQQEVVPEAKLQHFWREVSDSSRTSSVTFEPFLLWYIRQFGDAADGRQAAGNMFREFYRSIRPVRGFHDGLTPREVPKRVPRTIVDDAL